MMNERPPGSVTQLDEYRYRHVQVRQAATSAYLHRIADRAGEEAPVAGAGILVLPDGNITIAAFNLEQEHVAPAISAMRRLIERMESFNAGKLASRCLTATGVSLAALAADLVLEPALAAPVRAIQAVICCHNTL